MVVDPAPGATLMALRQTIWELSIGLQNAQSTVGTSGDGYNAYIRWANDAAQQLVPMASGAAIDRLVLTRRFWHLQAMPSEGAKGRLGSLLDAEIRDRRLAFDETITSLDKEIQRWATPAVYVLPDTSFYIRHSDKLGDADIAMLMPVREETIRILVPILIVDELDRLKESGQRHIRWRAGYTVAVLDRLLPNPDQRGLLRREDFSGIDERTGAIPRGQVSMEILFDPPGHMRLPLLDDEIVDRAVAAQSRIGRPIHFLTYDTSQSLRARRAGLTVTKLQKELGDEPAQPRN